MFEDCVNKSRIIVKMHELLKNDAKYDICNFNSNVVARTSEGVCYINNKAEKRLIIYLRGKGCAWSQTKYGGCFMCGHFHGTSKGISIPAGAFVEQVNGIFAKKNISDYPVICIYNAGNILNPDEIPRNELTSIFKTLSKYKNIRKIIIESRPEFIDSSYIKELKEILQDIELEIGIGLETADDNLRNLLINKGFMFSDYERAVKILKQYNVKILTYITVKHLFQTDFEAMNDVVNTVKRIINYTDSISLEPISVQSGTLIDYFFKNKLYEPPKGWLVIDIVKQLSGITNNIDLRIGGFEFYPAPYYVIKNCDVCTKKLYEYVNLYNSGVDKESLFSLQCSCLEEYRKKFEQGRLESRSIEERISDAIANIMYKEV